LRRVLAGLVRAALRLYHEKWRPRVVQLGSLRLWVPQGVFIPLGTVSTGLLLEALDALRHRGRILDIGCGSGALSIAAALRGWEAVCYDASPRAREAARLNAALNGVEDRVVVAADPGEVIELGPYDLIVSNPPYLPLDPADELDRLWCAGRDLSVLGEIGGLARRASPGSPFIAALSSLTPLGDGVRALGMWGWRVIRSRWAGLDRVYVVAGLAGPPTFSRYP
jgi:release factor glutamine methyltransferase